jgi:hypothetical protein
MGWQLHGQPGAGVGHMRRVPDNRVEAGRREEPGEVSPRADHIHARHGAHIQAGRPVGQATPHDATAVAGVQDARGGHGVQGQQLAEDGAVARHACHGSWSPDQAESGSEP